MNAVKKLFRTPGSIQRRLFWFTGGLGLGSLLIVNLIWLPSSIREIRESQAELQLVAVRGVRDEIQLFLEESAHTLRSQAALFRTPFVEGPHQELHDLARKFLQREPMFEEIGIVDHLGREILRESRRLVITHRDLRDLWAQSFFQEGMRRATYWGPVALTETSEPWVTLAVPLQRSDSITAGVVYGVLNLRALWSLTREFKLSRAGRAYLADQEGKLIAADDPALVRKRLRLADRNVVQQALRAGGFDAASFVTGGYSNENGEEVMATGILVPGPQWPVVVEQPQSALYVPIKHKLWFSLGLSFLGLLVCFGLAYFFSERFTGPITRLREGVERIAEGNLDQRVAVEAADEIGELAGQFNRMAQALKESYQGLEEKIAERTADLSALYSALTPLAQSEADPLLQTVAERLKEATHADAALIRILDTDSQSFADPANVGFPSSYLEATRDLDYNSAIGAVFTTGKPIIVRDIVQDPRLRGKRQLEAGLKSCAFLPLRVSGELRGIVHLASRKLGHFSEEKTDHLMTIARQMGVALENQELFYEVGRRAKEQEALNIIAKATSQSLRRDELLQIALDKVLELTGRERGTIRLKDPVTGEVSLCAHQGFSEEEIEILRRNVPHRASEQIFASGLPLVVNDRAEVRDAQSLLPQSRSVAWIPIKARQRVVGVLGISAGRPIPFFEREVELLQAIGSVIGVAVENVRLFEESQRQESIQRLLKELSQDITSLDINALFQKVADKVREFFKVDIADIRLLEEGDIPSPVGSSGMASERLYKRGASTGRSRWIAKNRRPLIIPDMMKAAGIASSDTVRELGIRGYLAVPLFSKSGEVIGILRALTYEPREFSESELDLLQQLVAGTAIALANARLFEETEQRAHEQAVLNAIAMTTSQLLHLDELLQIALEKVLEATGREQGYIRLKDPVTGSLTLAAHRGISEKFVQTLLHERRAGGKSDQVFESGEPLVINDPEGSVLKEETRREGSRSMSWFPLKVRGEVVGIMNVSTTRPITFQPREVELLKAIGNVIGVALENARLYEETQVREAQLQETNRRLSALHAVAAAASQSLDTDRVLNSAIEKITEMFRFDATQIHIYHEPAEELLLKAYFETQPQRFASVQAFRRGQGIVGKVAETGMPLIFEDVQSDPVYSKLSRTKTSSRFGYRFFAVFPIKGKQKTLGTLACTGVYPRTLSSGERQLLEAIADQVAVAIENAGLYKEVRRRLEELQQKTEELQRANKVKDEFLSVMSHELRTPINVVMGYAAMIKDGLVGGVTAEQDQALAKLMARGREQLSMIDGILQVTQIEAHKLSIEQDEVKLAEFLDELKSDYGALRANHKTALAWQYSADLPAITTDRKKLRQVLSNLINNAIKFTPHGGVTVSARVIEGRRQKAEGRRQKAEGKREEGDQEGRTEAAASETSASCLLPPASTPWVEFKVADTGVGIPQGSLAVIFEKFRQVDSSETRRYAGVGIGLYIVRHFSELLGGKVEVESESGRGSTFTVTLPCAAAEEDSSAIRSVA